MAEDERQLGQAAPAGQSTARQRGASVGWAPSAFAGPSCGPSSAVRGTERGEKKATRCGRLRRLARDQLRTSMPVRSFSVNAHGEVSVFLFLVVFLVFPIL